MMFYTSPVVLGLECESCHSCNKTRKLYQIEVEEKRVSFHHIFSGCGGCIGDALRPLKKVEIPEI